MSESDGESFRRFLQTTAPIVSGLLFVLAFLWSSVLWWLSFVALVPLLFFLRSADTARRAFLGAYCTGVFLVGSSVAWYWNVLPLDWLELSIQPAKAVLYVAISFLIAVFVLAFPIGLWGVLVHRSLSVRKIVIPLLFVPLVWVLLEYARAWLYALLTYKTGVAMGPHFTIGFLGYFLSYHPFLLQLAALGGVYLLSAIILFANTTAFLTAERIQHSIRVRGLLVVLALVAVVLTGAIPLPTNKTEVISIAAVHTNFPARAALSREDYQERAKTFRVVLHEVAEKEETPSVVVFPEGARVFATLPPSEIAAFFSSSVQPMLVDSGLMSKNGETYSRLAFFREGVSLATQDKIFLAPQGEYIPGLFGAIVKVFGDTTDALEQHHDYRSGDRKILTVESNGIVVGGLFCSELFSPNLYREEKKAGANLLVNAASHSVFHESRLLYDYFKSVAKVRAVENRLPLVVAGNVVPSFAVSAQGQIVAEGEWGPASVLFAEIALNKAVQ